MTFPEVPLSPDWYNENLKSEIRSFIPGILNDFQTEKAAGSLFAYERLSLDSSDKKVLEAYALLKLVRYPKELICLRESLATRFIIRSGKPLNDIGKAVGVVQQMRLKQNIFFGQKVLLKHFLF